MKWDVIWIIGQMGSGKSTVCDQLSAILSDYHHMNIDDYRREYNDSDEGHENRVAEQRFIEDLNGKEKILLESVGSWGKLIPHNKKCLKILLEVENSVATKRVIMRRKSENYQSVPGFSDDLSIILHSMKSIRDSFLNHNSMHDYEIDSTHISSEEVFNKVVDILKKEKVI